MEVTTIDLVKAPESYVVPKMELIQQGAEAVRFLWLLVDAVSTIENMERKLLRKDCYCERKIREEIQAPISG